MNTKSDIIPLFPLGVFLLPGESTQLHIFEERYKDLLKDCRLDAMGFGIPFSKQTNTKSLGSYVVISEILNTYPGGEMDIVVKCTKTFRLNKFFFQAEGKAYPGGEVVFFEKEHGNPYAGQELSFAFREKLPSFNFNFEDIPEGDLKIFEIANHLRMGDFEKLEFAGLDNFEQRDSYLLNYLRYLELLQEQESSVFENFYLN